MTKQIVTVEELYSDKAIAKKNNDLNIILNTDPKPEWVKAHPMARNVKYLPIERIEFLLTNIFIKWRVEVKKVQTIANSVVVTVRLHVKDPITNEWDFQDGVGAAPIQTKKGAAATDFTQVLSDALMKASPAAETYAIKDAAEKFGKIFGKDLNRSQVEYGWLSHRDLNPNEGTQHVNVEAKEPTEEDWNNVEKNISQTS